METLPTVTPHCSPTLEKKEIASLYNWVEITNDFKTSAESNFLSYFKSNYH